MLLIQLSNLSFGMLLAPLKLLWIPTLCPIVLSQSHQHLAHILVSLSSQIFQNCQVVRLEIKVFSSFEILHDFVQLQL